MKRKASFSIIAAALGIALAPAAFADDKQAGSSHRHGMSGSTAIGGASMASSETIREAQQALKDKGHDAGEVDGVMGPKTQAALRSFQQQRGIEATGTLDTRTLAALGVDSGSGASGAATSGSTTPPSGSSSTATPPSSSGSTTPSPSSGSTTPSGTSGSTMPSGGTSGSTTPPSGTPPSGTR